MIDAPHLFRFAVVFALSSSVAASNAVYAAPPQTADDPPKTPSPYVIPFERYTLPNGLEVILHPDRTLPLVAVNVWYHVGPANEPEGRSGFAHLFEHLMFEGSKHVGREFDHLLESVGATNVNGTTNWDRTNYFETVPSPHLEMVLWLESDRMGFMLDALEQERLDVQRDVVKNERRQRHDNAPYGPSDLAMYDILFPKGHPYHGAIIGSMEDLSRATMEDVHAFFRSFYAPSNATLAIAGDFDTEQTKGFIAQYFGTLPSAPKPPRPTLRTKPLASEARKVVEEPVQLARVLMSWITPPAYSDADVVLDVVAKLLAGGKATPLYQTLVVEKRLSPGVSAWVDSNELASTFAIEATAAKAATPVQVEGAIDAVLARLATEGPSDDALARAKAAIELEVRSTLQLLNGGGGESGRAGVLQRMNHYLGDPGKLPETMSRVVAVEKEDVKRVVTEQLRRDARAIVVTVPTPKKAAGR